MAYHIESISPTTNTYTFNNPHLASPLSIPAFNLNMPYNVNVNNTSGKYKFTIDSLWATVAPKCVKRSFTDGYANLTVYPAPTIAFSADPICADDALLLTFTGKENASSFTLDYKFTQSPDTTVPNNLKDPASIGLPSSFTPSTSGSVDVNGIQTYTTTINPGRPGVFKFYLHTITDGTCTNTVPAAEATSWKWW
jgi:hypothetical protein